MEDVETEQQLLRLRLYFRSLANHCSTGQMGLSYQVHHNNDTNPRRKVQIIADWSDIYPREQLRKVKLRYELTLDLFSQ